jgi:hypothetical protein
MGTARIKSRIVCWHPSTGSTLRHPAPQNICQMLYVLLAQRWCHGLRRGIRRPARLDSFASTRGRPRHNETGAPWNLPLQGASCCPGRSTGLVPAWSLAPARSVRLVVHSSSTCHRLHRYPESCLPPCAEGATMSSIRSAAMPVGPRERCQGAWHDRPR